ncbi:MAG TPA: PIG-L family deacetylase [Thermoanaerobaculia bacterium]
MSSFASFSLSRRAGAALVLAALAASTAALPERSPLEPASSGGLAALDRTLARLSTHRRLLVIAAHPDDEDTRLLTYVARGLGGEAAYLSLSRGEGGQNLIGPELGVGLGLLRSRELLAARGVDGARQFFTRAYDFGYTRSLEETFRLWPEQVLLEDAVRVIRRFKPQVVVAVFPPTERAGHGQHWASGVVAPAAIEAAADPAAFPELAAEGLAPWRAATFFRSAFFDREAATLRVPLGALEPFSGRSIFQISMWSRSQHRCQDMGNVLPLGDAEGFLIWQQGGGGPGTDDVFAGVDTRLEAVADLLAGDALAPSVGARLGRVGELAAGARRDLSPVAPGAAVEPLVEIVRLLREVDRDLTDDGEGGNRHVRDLVAEKLDLAEEALATAAGVLADAYAERETVTPGGRLPVRSVFWNAGGRDVSAPRVEVVSADGWRAAAVEPPPEERSFFNTEVSNERLITVEVPAQAPPTVPYFLRSPLLGALYDWSEVPADVRGQPFEDPPLALRFAFTVEGVPVELEREVVHRYRDQARGEIRRPLRAVPPLEVTVEPELVVWPIGERSEERLQVVVRSHVDEPVSARLEVAVPPGWPAPAASAVEIAEPRGRQTLEVVLRAPEDVRAGRHEVAVAAVTADGERFGRSFPLVDYEHVRPTPMPRDARVTVSAAVIGMPDLGRLGYVRGAADKVPELLRAIGLPVELLDEAALADADLAAFDAIVVGSRAYESDAGLARANGRLLDYVRGGGLLIVQYQQYQFVQGGFTPYPLDIGRPHGRVTDETAPVRQLVPDHPVFTTPNAIASADWEGWVQERGLYFAGTWDDAYEPLLATADPGGEEQRGALLVARYGEGWYVYTGLAFFRQLPAGVPGAYRLFANLLALGRKD